MGSRVHHAQVFRDKYLVLEAFACGARYEDGLNIFILDPEADEIIDGIRDEELGGRSYTSWADQDGNFIYMLMEPFGLGAHGSDRECAYVVT